MRINGFRTVSAVILLLIVTFALVCTASAEIHYKVLYTFNPGIEGPPGPLVFSPDGILFGADLYGGGYLSGTIFRLIPNADGTWNKDVIYTFTGGTDGGIPESSLTFDAAGNLFGTTQAGGDLTCEGVYVAGCGTVFKLSPNQDGSWTESVLHAFHSGIDDGTLPYYSGVVLDKAGNLYGTTWSGGVYGAGTVYMVSPNPDGSWTESLLHSFGPWGGGDGLAPSSGVIIDAAGNLYGTTNVGGVYGTVFQLRANVDGTFTERILHSFTNGIDGGMIQAGLVLDTAGNLYGAAEEGGAYGCGTIFQMKPNADGSWKTNVIHTFIGDKDGRLPVVAVILSPSGDLYGLASAGRWSYGVAFRLTPNQNGGWREYVLHNFSNHRDGGFDFPLAPMVTDAAGNLYGSTQGGNPTRSYVIFEITWD